MIKTEYLTLTPQISPSLFIQDLQSVFTINPEIGEFSYSSPSMKIFEILEINLKIFIWFKETREISDWMQGNVKTCIEILNLSDYNVKREIVT